MTLSPFKVWYTPRVTQVRTIEASVVRRRGDGDCELVKWVAPGDRVGVNHHVTLSEGGKRYHTQHLRAKWLHNLPLMSHCFRWPTAEQEMKHCNNSCSDKGVLCCVEGCCCCCCCFPGSCTFSIKDAGWSECADVCGFPDINIASPSTKVERKGRTIYWFFFLLSVSLNSFGFN